MEVDVPSGVNAPRGFFLADLNYGDLTGDGIEEAIVTLGIWSQGTSRHHCIFVYKMSPKKPERIWVYETGDRAYQGYRRAFSENGNLIVELYKPATLMVDGRPKELSTSTTYTRDSYQFKDGRFEKIKSEELPNTKEEGKPWVIGG
ncbi:MAG: hypothetical protein M3441_23455 [Chloroflexota bacterium]|nr:hypothetical protein [Chloroflexota bacterium]